MLPGARPRAGRLTTGLLVLGVAGGVLSACSSSVRVSPPPHAKECEPATAKWPATVGGRAARPVTVKAPAVRTDAAAWGDPAIIATCGWPALGPTEQECLAVDGVDWVAEPLSDGVRFTTFGRTPALEVLVPDAYKPEPLLLPAFRAVAEALPGNGRRCS